MINRVASIPHPIGFGLAYALVPAIAVFFILVAYAPYGFADLGILDRITHALPFGLITAVAAPVNLMIVKLIYPQFIDATRWTIGKEFIYNVYDILLIGLWNTIYLRIIGRSRFSFLDLLLEIETHTLLIGIIPMIALMALKNNDSLKDQLKSIRQMNEELKVRIEKTEGSAPIAFYSENEKLEIKLPPSSILFIQAEGNYLEIIYRDEQGKASKQLIRNRLKNVEKILSPYSFFQCHKSYLVNLDNISKAVGNARDLKLSFRETSQSIPVSRTKSDTLIKALKND